MQFVFCEVRIKSLLSLRKTKVSNWPRHAQAVSRRPLTAEDRGRSQVSPCEFSGSQSGTGTGFSPSTWVSSCQDPPPMFHIHLQLKGYVSVTRTNGRSLGAFQNTCSFGNRVAIRRRVLSLLEIGFRELNLFSARIRCVYYLHTNDILQEF